MAGGWGPEAGGRSRSVSGDYIAPNQLVETRDRFREWNARNVASMDLRKIDARVGNNHTPFSQGEEATREANP